jgi:hypothetical protein
VRIADLDLHSGDVRTVNTKLDVGAVTQTIGVEADLSGAELDKSNATVGGTIQSVQIAKIPLNGRNITNGTDDNNFRLDGDRGLRRLLRHGSCLFIILTIAVLTHASRSRTRLSH